MRVRDFGEIDVYICSDIEVIREDIQGNMCDDLRDFPFGEAGRAHRGQIRFTNLSLGVENTPREG